MAALPIQPSMEEMPTTAEPGLAVSSGSRACTSIGKAVRLMDSTKSQPSRLMEPTGSASTVPAAWTRPPMGPTAARLCSMAPG